MAKGQRKRANTKQTPGQRQVKQNQEPVSKLPDTKAPPVIMPFNAGEQMYIDQCRDLSNKLAKLKQQYDNYIYVRNQLTQRREKIQKGEIKMPILCILTPQPTRMYWEEDKQIILKELDGEIKTYNDAAISVKAQVTQHETLFKEAGKRTQQCVTGKFKNFMIENITTDRRINEQETKLFEAKYEEMLNNPDIQKEFKQALAKAKEMNTKKAKTQASQKTAPKAKKAEAK